MKEFTSGFLIERWIHLGLSLGMIGFVVACTPSDPLSGPAALNSRYTDEQPALSGNARFLAFVSNRNGSPNILLYD